MPTATRQRPPATGQPLTTTTYPTLRLDPDQVDLVTVALQERINLLRVRAANGDRDADAIAARNEKLLESLRRVQRAA